MINIPNTKLFIGSSQDLAQTDAEKWAVVHATQTYHYKLFGWDQKTNKPNKNHPNYIVQERQNNISLNWVDGYAYLYNWSGAETFIRVLNFIDKWIVEKNVLVYSDKGRTRAPTIGLLHMAKRLKIISNDSFMIAYDDFVKLYPGYIPGGIGEYVSNKWTNIT